MICVLYCTARQDKKVTRGEKATVDTFHTNQSHPVEGNYCSGTEAHAHYLLIY